MCSFPISTIFCETESPIIGVLANQRDSSVEGFNNYFNNSYMNDFLDKNYYYYNDVNCLFEFRSNFVLDNSTVSQVETDFYDALKKSFYIEIYGHETAITTTSGNVNANYLNVLEKVCQLINDNNLKSGYIQDNLPIINTKNYYFNDKTYATLFVNNFSPRNIIFPRNSQISTNIIPFKYFTVSGISTEKYACMTEAIDKAKTKKITISGNNSNLYRVGITQFRTHSMLLTNNNLNLEYNTFTPLSEKSTYELADDTLMYVISFSLVDKTRTLTLDDIYNIQNLNYTIG